MRHLISVNKEEFSRILDGDNSIILRASTSVQVGGLLRIKEFDLNEDAEGGLDYTDREVLAEVVSVERLEDETEIGRLVKFETIYQKEAA